MEVIGYQLCISNAKRQAAATTELQKADEGAFNHDQELTNFWCRRATKTLTAVLGVRIG
jgi:hypothetical protein